MNLTASAPTFIRSLLASSAIALCGLAPSLNARAVPATPKTLAPRLGFGVSNVGPGLGAPALSVDWQMNLAASLEFEFALDTRAANSSHLFGARYARNLFIEEHQMYFVYMGAGLLSELVAGTSASGYYLESGGGGRFFMPGLPNLGFSFGTGFRVDSPGAVSLHTVFFTGIHYYF